MAKIDDIIGSLEAGYQNPATALYRTWIEDKYMEQIKVRRKQTGVAAHLLWCLQLGDATDQQKALFYGHKPMDCIKKALEWRGLPTKSKTRKPAQPG